MCLSSTEDGYRVVFIEHSRPPTPRTYIHTHLCFLALASATNSSSNVASCTNTVAPRPASTSATHGWVSPEYTTFHPLECVRTHLGATDIQISQHVHCGATEGSHTPCCSVAVVHRDASQTQSRLLQGLAHRLIRLTVLQRVRLHKGELQLFNPTGERRDMRLPIKTILISYTLSACALPVLLQPGPQRRRPHQHRGLVRRAQHPLTLQQNAHQTQVVVGVHVRNVYQPQLLQHLLDATHSNHCPHRECRVSAYAEPQHTHTRAI